MGGVPYGMWGPASQEGKGGALWGSALSHLLYFWRKRRGGVGPGREEARVWTFHALQIRRTRAAEGPWSVRGANSCFLGGTGSNTALFSLGRSGKLVSSWRHWGRPIGAFLLVRGVLGNLGTMRTESGRLPWPRLGPGRPRR